MPIRRFLATEFFDPELIETMGGALMDACKTLEMKKTDDVAMGIMAKRIIEAATNGVRERGALKAAALKGSEN